MHKISWKKNLLGYVLWICFCITVCTAFVTAGIQIFNRIGIRNLWVAVTVTVVLFVAEIGLFFWLYPGGRGMRETKKKKCVCIKYLPELLAVILLLLLRGAAVMAYGVAPMGDMTLYEMAEIVGTETVPLLPHNASYIYTCLLSVLLSFLGNKWVAVVIMQVLLQLVISLLFFQVVRKLYGRTVSVAFLLLAAVMPDFLFCYNRITPDLLLGLAAGVIFLAATELFENFASGKGWKCVCLSLFSGMLTGLFIWLDISGLIVWLALIICVVQLKTEDCIVRKWISVCSITMGAAAVLLSVFWAESSMTGIGYVDAAYYYLQTYVADVRFILPQMDEFFSVVATFVLCMLSVMALVGFLKQNYEKTLMPAVMLSGMLALRCFNMTCVSYGNLENLFWLLAVCAGIQCMVDVYEAEDKAGEKEKGATEVTEEKNTSAENNYIPNPLPLPKKHIKREIKFDYEPTKEQMKFDYELKKGEEDFDFL